MGVEEAYSNQMRARYRKALNPTHRWGGSRQDRALPVMVVEDGKWETGPDFLQRQPSGAGRLHTVLTSAFKPLQWDITKQ